jgi:hypothetical protein
LDAAVKQYEQEIGKANKSEQNVADAEKNVKKALDGFQEIEKNLGPAVKAAGREDLLAKIQLEKLNAIREQLSQFLSAYTKEEAADGTSQVSSPSAKVAGQVAAVLIGATKEIQESSTHAMLVPLIFDQERLRLEVERLQRIQERGEQRIALLEHQRDRYIAEGMKLMDARNTLVKASSGDASLQALLSGDNKELAFHAIIVWVQSIAVDKLREEQVEVALISLDHDEALDASEFALNLWKYMVAAPVEQLLAYHASGLTPDEIARLFQAASLAGVAVGVNR